MTNEHDDREIRIAYKALGSGVEAGAPSFAELAAPAALNAVRRRRRIRQGVAALGVVIAVAAAITMQPRPDSAIDYEQFTAVTGIDLSLVTWEAPSDFLFHVPGRELLDHVPTIELSWPAVQRDSVPTPDTNASRRRSRS